MILNLVSAGNMQGCLNLDMILTKYWVMMMLNIFWKFMCCSMLSHDTIVLAESSSELQKALDAVHQYCENWKLTVNTDKTKIVIFSKCKMQNYPAFLFGHKIIQVVDDYVYLGIEFNYNGSFNKAISKQVLQGKKAFYALLDNVDKLCLPVDISLELFDQLVLPVLFIGMWSMGFW